MQQLKFGQGEAFWIHHLLDSIDRHAVSTWIHYSSTLTDMRGWLSFKTGASFNKKNKQQYFKKFEMQVFLLYFQKMRWNSRMQLDKCSKVDKQRKNVDTSSISTETIAIQIMQTASSIKPPVDCFEILRGYWWKERTVEII